MLRRNFVQQRRETYFGPSFAFGAVAEAKFNSIARNRCSMAWFSDFREFRSTLRLDVRRLSLGKSRRNSLSVSDNIFIPTDGKLLELYMADYSVEWSPIKA